MTSRLSRFAWLVAMAGALACSGDRQEASAPPPHVLLISIDTLRSDHLGAYGYERDTSPALDRLAADGARFTTSYAQAASTVPSHASLFTGRFPFEHLTFGYTTPLPAAEETLAEVLRRNGYRTVSITSSIRFVEGSGFEQGFDRHEVLRSKKNDRSQVVVDRVVEEITAESEKPAFVFAHFFDPHEPYAPPAEFEKRWHPGVEELAPTDTSKFIQAHRRPHQDVAPDTLEYLEALYDAEILYLDQHLGRLFEALEAADTGRSILIVVTSDHGEEFKEHGGLSHAGNVHEELIRVPLIFKWTGHIIRNSVLDVPVQGADVFPTLLELLGIEPDVAGSSSGRSHAKLLTGAELYGGGDRTHRIVSQQNWAKWALTESTPTGRFRLVSQPPGSPALYRLDDDPEHRQDVSAQYPDIARALFGRAKAMGLIRDPNAPPPSERDPEKDAAEVSPEVLEQLRAIGYADEVEAGR